ncbi:MAG: hypothetical protein AAF203_08005, partial [Pseudomonadota bacterium]
QIEPQSPASIDGPNVAINGLEGVSMMYSLETNTKKIALKIVLFFFSILLASGSLRAFDGTSSFGHAIDVRDVRINGWPITPVEEEVPLEALPGNLGDFDDDDSFVFNNCYGYQFIDKADKPRVCAWKKKDLTDAITRASQIFKQGVRKSVNLEDIERSVGENNYAKAIALAVLICRPKELRKPGKILRTGLKLFVRQKLPKNWEIYCKARFKF